jgi:hypothetical protein
MPGYASHSRTKITRARDLCPLDSGVKNQGFKVNSNQFKPKKMLRKDGKMRILARLFAFEE